MAAGISLLSRSSYLSSRHGRLFTDATHITPTSLLNACSYYIYICELYSFVRRRGDDVTGGA